MTNLSRVDPTPESQLSAAEWLSACQAEVADAAARRDRETAALLAAIAREPGDPIDLARRNRETAAALEEALAERARRTREHFPEPRRGWLAGEIDRRGGAPYDAEEIF